MSYIPNLRVQVRFPSQVSSEEEAARLRSEMRQAFQGQFSTAEVKPVANRWLTVRRCGCPPECTYVCAQCGWESCPQCQDLDKVCGRCTGKVIQK